MLAYCHHLKAADTQIAWYALDKQDNDPARFAAYLMRAFRPEDAQQIEVNQGDKETYDLEEVVTLIMNWLAEDASEYVFALDDYHLITNPTIHHSIAMMLDHLPRNGQLLIGTRNGLLVFHNSPAPLLPILPPTQVPPGPGDPPEIAPTEAPTAQPTEEPVPTEEPTAEPTPTEEPTAEPPVAVIAAPVEGAVNQIVKFDGSNSTSGVSITIYEWDFGDGVKANGVAVEHKYAQPGTYIVTLTITDSDGKTASATHTITIQ